MLGYPIPIQRIFLAIFIQMVASLPNLRLEFI